MSESERNWQKNIIGKVIEFQPSQYKNTWITGRELFDRIQVTAKKRRSGGVILALERAHRTVAVTCTVTYTSVEQKTVSTKITLSTKRIEIPDVDRSYPITLTF